MLGEVGEVLGAERGERRLSDEAAGGDPGVVDGPWPATELGVRLQFAPSERTRAWS